MVRDGASPGTDIVPMIRVEEYLDGVTEVASAIGGGDVLTASSSNAVGFAKVDDYALIDTLIPKVQRELEEFVREGVVAAKKLRISGSDREELREMGQRVKRIMVDAGAIAVRDEWKKKVKVIRPQVADTQAHQQGIERDELLPIVARAPQAERGDVRGLRDIQIWSPAAQRMIPIRQLVKSFTTEFEDANIWRRNRTTTIKIKHSDKIPLASRPATSSPGAVRTKTGPRPSPSSLPRSRPSWGSWCWW